MGSLLIVTSCAFVFFCFTIEKNQLASTRKRHVMLLILLPEFITVTLILLTPWTGWIFSLSEADTLIHGPAYPVMLFSSSMYLVVVVVLAIHNITTAHTISKKRYSAALLLSVLIIILFVILDDLLLKASILPAAVFAVIIVIFINMQESHINSDALTGMNNRRKADEYLSGQLSFVTDDNPLYLFMCDLNGFKSINDVYGHLEGDEALIISGNTLKRTISHYSGFAARFGGDEFLLSIRPSKGVPLDPEALIGAVNQELGEQAKAKNKPYSLSMTIGYAVCADRNEALNSCIGRADQMLYQRKRELPPSARR